MKDGGFFVLRNRKIDELPHLRRTVLPFSKTSHPLPSSVRSSIHYSRQQIEDGKGVLRFSGPKIEDGRDSSTFGAGRSYNPPSSTFEVGRSSNLPSSIFHLRSGRSKNPLASSFTDRGIKGHLLIFDLRSRILGRRSPSAPWCIRLGTLKINTRSLQLAKPAGRTSWATRFGKAYVIARSSYTSRRC